MLPTRRHRAGHPQTPAYLALHLMGFTLPPTLTEGAVGSYPTFSPLPDNLLGHPAVCFLWHFPSPHGGSPLATIIPYGVRTFLCAKAQQLHPHLIII